MAITVNTNVSSINAQRNLTKSTNSLNTAMQRLSSGLRINTAADDAAGLAISTGITSQVNGLTQAERNANDGLSVVGTATGALDTETTILQRIRELSVQAANDINSTDDRQAIQDEINAQISELTRLGNTTTFNGINLLDGSFTNKKLQVGAYANQTINVSLGDFRSSAMGYLATTTGTAVGTYALSAGDIKITSYNANGTSVGPTSIDGTVSDGVSYAYANASGIAKANAINSASATTGVTATVNKTSWVGTSAITGTTTWDASGANTLTVNGVNIFGTATSVTASDGTGTLAAAINAKTSQTGVKATVSSGILTLSADDGRNITVLGTGAVGTLNMGLTTAVASTKGSTITLNSTRAFSISLSGTGGTAANTGFTSGGMTNLDTTKNVGAVDVTTQSGANTAILIVDSALSAVSDAQSSLGALSNRLTNTISNIEVANENLSAANSRIQDTDFATETANMTRAQIIQQSSVAVLTQANSLPQIALTLLKG
jgi:flagellin